MSDISKEYGVEKVSVQQAAKELSLTPAQVRIRMQYGVLPIGEIFRRKHGKRYQYTIYRGMLDKYKSHIRGES